MSPTILIILEQYDVEKHLKKFEKMSRSEVTDKVDDGVSLLSLLFSERNNLFKKKNG